MTTTVVERTTATLKSCKYSEHLKAANSFSKSLSSLTEEYEELANLGLVKKNGYDLITIDQEYHLSGFNVRHKNPEETREEK